MQDRLTSLRGPMGLVRGAGLAAGLAMLLAPAALAGVPVVTGGTLTFTQDTFLNTTTIRFVGAINTNGLPVIFSGEGSAMFSNVRAAAGTVSIGPGLTFATTYTLPVGAVPIFSPTFVNPPTGTFIGPDAVAFFTNGQNGDQLRLPVSYVSGSPIDAAMRMNGTFATLSIVPGTYTATIPGNGPITYVFNTIPTPGAAALLAAGGLVVGGRRRR